MKREIDEVKKELEWFFQKYNLKIEKISEDGFIYKNKDLELNFVYGRFSNYADISFENLLIKDKGEGYYDFKDIVILMERNKKVTDIREELKLWKNYSQYFKTYFILFLEMDNHIEKIEKYIESLGLPY